MQAPTAGSPESARLQARALVAGSCPPRRSRFTCASVWPTVSRSFGCRCRRRSASPSPSTVPRTSAFSGSYGHQLRLENLITRLDIYAVFCVFRICVRDLGRLARESGTAQRRRGCSLVLVRRTCHRRIGRHCPPTLASLARVRSHRRHWAWPRIYLAGAHVIKWFPDRRGMATGMAIMEFGGGAMIGAPLADRLMKLFATPTTVVSGRHFSRSPPSISYS